MTSEAQDELDSFDAPVYVFKSVGAYNAFHDDNQSAEVEIPGSSSPGNVGGFAIGTDDDMILEQAGNLGIGITSGISNLI